MLFHLKRVGPWMFAVLIGWYITGSMISNHIKERQKILMQNQHKNILNIDSGTNQVLAIRYTKPNEKYPAGLNATIVFNPRISRVSVTNNNLSLNVRGKSLEDKFVLDIEKVKSRSKESNTNLFVQLPPTIHAVELSGLSDVSIAGNFNQKDVGLNLIIADGKTDVDIKNLKAHHLVLTSNSGEGSADCKCSASFDVGKGVNIAILDVFMQHGSFSYEGKNLPAQTRLFTDDNVNIEAPTRFFHYAIFEKP